MSYDGNHGAVAKLANAAVCKTAIIGSNPIRASKFQPHTISALPHVPGGLFGSAERRSPRREAQLAR